MYTKNEILLESAFYGDLTKIEVATDMMCESYMDQMFYAENDEEFTEAGKGVINVIKTMITSTMGKIIKFVQDKLDALKKSAELKKIKAALNMPKQQEVLKNDPKAKVKLPNIMKAVNLLDKAEMYMNAMVKKSAAEIIKINKMKGDRAAKASEHLVNYINISGKNLSKIYDEIDVILRTPYDVSVKNAFQYLREADNVIERYSRLKKELETYQKDMLKIVGDMDFSESVSEIYSEKTSEKKDIPSAEDAASSAKSRKKAISSTLSGITSFTKKHAKTIALVVTTLATVASGIVIFKKNEKIKDLSRTNMNLYNDYLDNKEKIEDLTRYNSDLESRNRRLHGGVDSITLLHKKDSSKKVKTVFDEFK